MKSFLNEVIGGNYYFEIGSATIGKVNSDIEFVKEQVKETIYHYLFDMDKYLNGNLTSEEKNLMINEFNEREVSHRIDNLEDTLSKEFYIDYLYQSDRKKKLLKYKSN